MAKKQGLEWTTIKRLGELQKSLGVNLTEMISLVEKILHEEPYTKTEIAMELDTTPEKLDEISLTPNTKQIQRFKLKQRAMHVFRGELNSLLFLLYLESRNCSYLDLFLSRFR